MLNEAKKHLPISLETLRPPTPLRFGGHVAQGDLRLTLSWLLLALLLTACVAPTPPTPTATPAPSIPTHCIAQSDDSVPYFNLTDDYCLLYPANFRVSDLNSRIANFYGPPLDLTAAPLFAALTILIEDAASGRTLSQVVDDYIRQFGVEAPASRTTITLGGESAEVVEDIPGRAGSREAFVIHNNAVYHVSAYPLNDPMLEARHDVEAVWQAVTTSLTFLPPGFAEAFSNCPAGNDNAAPYLSFDQGFCLLYPSQMSITVIDAAQQIEFSGSSRAPGPEAAAVSVFVYSGEAANGRSVDQVADEYLAQFPADQTVSVTRTPITLGGQPGVMMDGAPGLTRTRQAFVIHKDRVYQFTLSPFNDPALADYQAEAEAVWQTVASSLVFVSKP